jgi:hypothetical protein
LLKLKTVNEKDESNAVRVDLLLSQAPPPWSDQVRNERRSILPPLLRKVSKH